MPKFTVTGDVDPFLQIITGANPNYSPAADINCDGRNDAADVPGFVSLLLGP